MWVSDLPAHVRLAPEVFLGAHIVSGQPTVVVLAAGPSFTGALTQAQSGLANEGARVKISSPSGGQVEGTVVERRSEAQDPSALTLVLEVNLTDCGDTCTSIDPDGITHLTGALVTVEPSSGLTVPTAAIRTDEQGATFVRDPDGAIWPVAVVQSARGISVVEGLSEGMSVQIPGGAGP